MRRFMVIEASDTPGPDFCAYRAMTVHGRTCSEKSLTGLANGMSRGEGATVVEAVTVLARGGTTDEIVGTAGEPERSGVGKYCIGPVRRVRGSAGHRRRGRGKYGLHGLIAWFGVFR